ncbi:integrase catalytic domain-containing protein [Trichonephila clavipes]|nr:integrase catalytic domain-containing protein [Trichonephila clavipes]
MLSRPVTQEEESFCEANNITIADMLTRSCVLYRYVPEADSAEAQLVIPTAERELILQRHHNDPMAVHYGEDGTFQKIAKRFYWTGMKKTPVYSQRFEVIAIDLFGPLPQTDSGKQWIFIVEDCATKWVELLAVSQVSARQSTTTLIEEVFMRHSIPRRIISDNGTHSTSKQRPTTKGYVHINTKYTCSKPLTASTAISSRTIHPSTKATTTTANSSDSVSSPGRRWIHRGRL